MCDGPAGAGGGGEAFNSLQGLSMGVDGLDSKMPGMMQATKRDSGEGPGKSSGGRGGQVMHYGCRHALGQAGHCMQACTGLSWPGTLPALPLRAYNHVLSPDTPPP